jgi:hypothetical protein
VTKMAWPGWACSPRSRAIVKTRDARWALANTQDFGTSSSANS